MNCMKAHFQDCGRALWLLIRIFRNKLLNIISAAYDFFVIVCLFLRPQVSGCVHVANSWYKPSRERAYQLEAMHLYFSYFNCSAPISNVEVKYTGSCKNKNEKVNVCFYTVHSTYNHKVKRAGFLIGIQ